MTKEELLPPPQCNDNEKHEPTTKTQMHWQHKNKRGNRKALNPAVGTSILSQTKHPEQAKTLRNPKSGRQGVHFLSNQTTVDTVQRRTTSIAKGKVSDGKLTKVRDEHSLVGKKSTGSKSKAGDEEGEEQRPVGRRRCNAGRKTPKQEKAKRWPKKYGAPLFIGIQKPRYSKGQATWKCFPKPNEETCYLTTNLDWCDPSLQPQMTRVPRHLDNLKKQIIRSASTCWLPDRIEADRLRGHCGGFPFTCPPLNQKPLVRPR